MKLSPRIKLIEWTASILLMILIGTLSPAHGQTALFYGDVVQDSLNAQSQINSYTFSGSVDDIITVRMDGNWSNGPQLELYSPVGGLLKRISCNTFGCNSTRIDTFRLSSAGTYTILAMDDDGQQTGNYGLHLQRTFDPGQATPISAGQTLQDTISLRAQTNAYTFSGSTDEVITVRMDGSWSNGPQLELYSPVGGLLKRISCNTFGCNSTRIDTFRLSSGGTYTILAMDDDGQQTGNYGLHLQRTFDPGQATPITAGQTLQDTLSLRAQTNAYTFSGSTDEVITVRMDGNWSNGPQLELYSPVGGLLKRISCNTFGCNSTRIDTFRLSSAGTYTILAMDDDGQQIGTYSLNFTVILTDIPPEDDKRVGGLPTDFVLEQNYPNPFNPSTSIRYALPAQTPVSLRIYDLLGREVRNLVDEVQGAGYKAVEWDSDDNLGSPVAGGVYLYRLQTREFTQTKKLVLIR